MIHSAFFSNLDCKYKARSKNPGHLFLIWIHLLEDQQSGQAVTQGWLSLRQVSPGFPSVTASYEQCLHEKDRIGSVWPIKNMEKSLGSRAASFTKKERSSEFYKRKKMLEKSGEVKHITPAIQSSSVRLCVRKGCTVCKLYSNIKHPVGMCVQFKCQSTKHWKIWL